MDSKRSWALCSKFIEIVNDINSSARSFHLTHDKILERLNERLYSHPQWNKVPEHVRSYVRGYMRAKHDDYYKYHLVWCMYIDGELLTSDEVKLKDRAEKARALHIDPNYKSPWARCENEKSRHVWKGQNGVALKDKPF